MTTGELDRAEEILREVLGAYTEQYGDVHAETLGILHNLALVLTRQGALSNCRTLSLKDHHCQQHVITSLPDPWRLPSLSVDAERTEEARAAYAKLLAGRRAALGDRHADTLRTVNNFAALRLDTGAPDAALLL